MSDPISLHADDGIHNAAVEALYRRAFGPGRFAKAAARLREGNTCLRAYSVLAFSANELIGACRLWPVVADGGTQALFLGPIAVDAKKRNVGLGQRMVEACLAAIDAAKDKRCVILVGDLAYFGKMGFNGVPKGGIALPGPVDPARLLWRHANADGGLLNGLLSVPRVANQTS